MFRDMVRGALQREAGVDKVMRWADSSDLSAFSELATKNGWSAIGLAEELGGQGGSLIEQAILFEELGRSVAPSGALLAAAGAVAFGAGVAPTAGEKLQLTDCALCLSAGQAADVTRTSLREVRGQLTGSVPLVLAAPGARAFLVPMSSGNGMSLWHVPANQTGVNVTPRRLIDKTREFGDVHFQNVEATRIGSIDAAKVELASASLVLLVAAESLGLARRMLAMTVEYVGQRVQFGVPVGSFQAVKHAAAEAYVDIEAAHSGIYYAAWALANQEADAVLHAWIAKAFASEAGARTADRALQLHGAIGYTWEYDLQLFYKRAKANVELFGSPRSYRERIAAARLDL